MKAILLIFAIFVVTAKTQQVSAVARFIDGSATFTGTTGSSIVTFTDSKFDGACVTINNQEIQMAGDGANWMSVIGSSSAWCSSPGQSFVQVIRTDGSTSTIVAEAEVTSGSPDFNLYFADEGFTDSIYEVHAAVISGTPCTTTLSGVNWTMLQPVNL